MILIGLMKQWLLTPPLKGAWVLTGVGAALAVPTLLRESLDGIVTGVGFAPYFPFVLLSAVLMGGRAAIVVALASAVLADALFVGPPNQLLEGPTDVFGALVFLATSALIIGLVQAIRSLIADWLESQPFDCSKDVIFSMRNSQVWASWQGTNGSVCLGAHDNVTETMEDYLEETKVAKRLFNRSE